MSDSVTELIRKWVVNGYFTPNIKAEVILGNSSDGGESDVILSVKLACKLMFTSDSTSDKHPMLLVRL